MRIETIAVHAGHRADPTTGAVTQPIHLSTTFEREADGSYRGGFIYSRDSNPNRLALEESLAALEGGGVAMAFASGSAATMTLLQTLVPGDHVIAAADAYYGTLKLLREVFGPFGIEASFVEMHDATAVARAMTPRTKLVWMETPSNPHLSIADIEHVSRIAHDGGAICAVDNTWATPMGQRPLALGADVSMHSTTKYLGGNSDVLSGALILKEENARTAKLRAIQRVAGAVPSPFDCWLLMRGIRTLPYRMRAHTTNAQRVAEFLAAHPGVERVHYPGLPSHVNHDVAARQMTLFGGMLSFEVPGGREAALAMSGRLKLITRATSLGGPETLIEHRASVEGVTTRAPEGLLRLSVGLEHAEDLVEDLGQALG